MANKCFSADFKAKVAIEAIKGNKSINELTSEFEFHAQAKLKFGKSCYWMVPRSYLVGKSRRMRNL